MRRHFLIVLLLAAAGAASAQPSSATALSPIPGFELRVLNRKVPLQIAVGEHVETRELTIWVHMPKRGEVPADVDEVTVPDDLSGGTTVLPPPVAGFGLRALRAPYRETFTLSNGRVVVIDAPVFIYYPKVPAGAALVATPSTPPPAKLQQQADPEAGLAKQYASMWRELRQLKDQFADVLSIIPDGTAKERLRELSGKLASFTSRYDTSFAYNPDGSVDKNIP